MVEIHRKSLHISSTTLLEDMTMANTAGRKRKVVYRAGQRGNRVSIIRERNGILYIQAYSTKDKAARQRSLGHSDLTLAKREADLRVGELIKGTATLTDHKYTLGEILKGWQDDNPDEAQDGTVQRRIEMFKAVFGRSFDPMKITKSQWKRFLKLRASGEIDGRGNTVDPSEREPVGENLKKDVAWLRSLFKWAAFHGEMLPRSPIGDYKTFPAPKINPVREVATEERVQAIRAVADQVMVDVKLDGRRQSVRSCFAELFDLACGTGRRIGAIRQLRYSDLRLQESELHPFGAIAWPSETDKQNRQRIAPLNPLARAAIDRVLKERPAIGSGYLFPAPRDPEQAVSKSLVKNFMRRAEALAGVPGLDRTLWHCYRRKWATDRMHLADTIVAEAGGWADAETMRASYQIASQQQVLTAVLNTTPEDEAVVLEMNR